MAAVTDTIRFWIDPDGVIRWREKGWPGPVDDEYITKPIYDTLLSRAKAESVPVRDHDRVAMAILMSEQYFWMIAIEPGKFYDVPANEIKKEWL